MSPAKVTSASTTTPITGPVLRADRQGYVIGNEHVDGFEDRPDLDASARLKIARWAQRFTAGVLVDGQRELLRRYDAEGPDPAAIEEMAAFAENDDQLQRLTAQDLYSHLSDEQKALVRYPGSHAELAGTRYPLGIGQMKLLTGSSERQLRHWADNGMVPTHWSNGRRVFYSAGLIRAMALAEAEQYQKTSVGAVARGGEEGARLLRLVGATVLANVVPRVPDSAREELSLAARTLIRHSEVIGHISTELAIAPKMVQAKLNRARVRPAAAASNAAMRRAKPLEIRHVLPRADGAWGVHTKPAARTIRRYRTRTEAIQAARTFIAKCGGGKVVIHTKSGKTKTERLNPHGATARSSSQSRSGREGRSTKSGSGTADTRVARAGKKTLRNSKRSASKRSGTAASR